MNQMPPESAKNLLKNRSILPQKRLGQNFLADNGQIQKVLEAADVGPDDIILEIGPGTGSLTLELAKKAKKVIAVEKDRKMAEVLKEQLANAKNVEIIQGDIRNTNPVALGLKAGDYKVVANIPYYLTAFLIRNLLENENPPENITLIIQKEVAQRICAKPPEMNLLAASVQFYANPKIAGYIKKTAFWPMPKVDSAIIKIQISKSKSQDINKELFFKVIKAGFSQPRKQLLNNLARGLKIGKEETKSWLLQNNIQPSQRAETLSMENWLSLTKSIFNDINKRPF
jgi:16S rRNA (adenine1518-N6/adenine1519-N6)-dimethyltransferase